MEPEKSAQSSDLSLPPINFSQPPPNFANSTHNQVSQSPYMQYVQQYAQNRLQQQLAGGGPDFYNQNRPNFFNQQQNNQQQMGYFGGCNKPIRFQLNAPNKVSPMFRPQGNPNQMNQNPFMNNNFQNQNQGKKRKNKKKKNKNKNGNFESDEGFNSFSSPPPLPPQPMNDFNNSSTSLANIEPPPPPTIESPAKTEASSSQESGLGSINSTDWPESLYNYVARCYMKCQTKIDRDLCEITLKGKITSAANRGELFTKDWDNEILPTVHSERTLQQATQIVPQSPTSQQPIHIFNKQAVKNNQYATNNSSNSPLNALKNAVKKGISSPLNARLGSKSSLKKKRSSSSSSRSPSPAKKRRSSSSSDDYYSKSKTSKKKLKKEKSAFYTKSGATGIGSYDDPVDSERLKKRADRFNKSSAKPTSSSLVSSFAIRRKFPAPTAFNPIIDDSLDDNLDLMNLHIVGTCRDLEKPFLRLTRAPEPSEVRPVEVLTYSLGNVKKRWVEKQDYYYVCDQLKSIRQDLTVQGIRDDFTVKVYETHAR
jgi:SAC3 family protein LENG8/THP3